MTPHDFTVVQSQDQQRMGPWLNVSTPNSEAMDSIFMAGKKSALWIVQFVSLWIGDFRIIHTLGRNI